jgi:hypothetical protein
VFALLSLVLGWLGSALPSLGKTAVEAYNAKLTSQNTTERIAADLAARELAVQQAETIAQNQLKIAEIGHWYEPAHLFAYIMVIYFGKIVLYDKVFAHWTGGSTDPLTGDAATWAGMIFAFYLGKRGIENVARIIKR